MTAATAVKVLIATVIGDGDDGSGDGTGGYSHHSGGDDEYFNLDAPHKNAIFIKIFRTLRTGARFFDEETTKFRGCSAQEHDFIQNFQDAPHGSAISSSDFSGCSAQEHDFLQNFLDAPQGSCSARECGFLQNFQDAPHGSAIFPSTKTTLSRAFWYRIGIGSIP